MRIRQKVGDFNGLGFGMPCPHTGTPAISDLMTHTVYESLHQLLPLPFRSWYRIESLDLFT
jgi:hypothetical protein